MPENTGNMPENTGNMPGRKYKLFLNLFIII